MGMPPGTGGGAAVAAIAEAIKASGVLVRMEPREFERIVRKTESPLVVVSESGIIRKKTNYLTSYKGLAFFAESEIALSLPDTAEIVHAKKIYMPG